MAPLLRTACVLLLLLLGAHLVRAELKLLHVVSANRFYVPDYNYLSKDLQVPKKLNYEYFVHHAYDMPNSIKMHLYNLGVFLKSRYRDFLGNFYHSEIIRMQTSESYISIIAAELINAGLWPPIESQIWNDELLWQPIPFEYLPPEEDTLLLGSLCPNFQYDTQHVLEHHQDLLTEEKDLLNFIQNEGGIHLENSVEASFLYQAIQNSMELNQTQPQWVRKIVDGKGLVNMTLKAYKYLAHSVLQRRLNGGSLLKDIIENSRAHINGTLPISRKINIYSGDDRVFAGLLNILKIPFFELPEPGAALIFELIENDKRYFIKIMFYMGSSSKEMIPYKLEGCDLICPLEVFLDLVSDNLPINEMSLCGSMVENIESGAAAMNTLIDSSVLHYYLLLAITITQLISQ